MGDRPMNDMASLPGNETLRLARLHALGVLDTHAESLFDQITRMAADLCHMPIALVSLIDAERQWFKSNIGLPGVAETPRHIAFCAHAILGDALMEVEDAQLDARFADNPLVTQAPSIRFYAGAPIEMPGGERLGTLCVIDREPRRLNPSQRQALQGLGRMVATALLERETRLRLTKELAASESSYRTIVEGQTELVSLALPDGTLAYVNQAYAQFCGERPQDMLSRDLLDFVAASDRPAVKAHLHQVCSEGGALDGVNRSQRLSDGEVRWMAWTNRLLPAQGDRPAMIHSVGRDVTAQKQAEAALAASEARFRQLYESTPAMLHSIDLQGRLLNVSDAWLNKLGYARHEVLGRPSSEFLTQHSREHALKEVLPAFFKDGRCDKVEYQFLSKDGRAIDMQLSAVLEHDSEGRPVRSLAVMEDISERKATAASLRETAHTLQLVMDNLPARISYWTPEHRNIFANQAFMDAFGAKTGELSGRYAWDIMGPLWWEGITPSVERATGGQESHVELSFIGADGVRRDTELRFKPDLMDGEIQGMFVISMDLTQHRQTERELARERQQQQAGAERALAEKETLLKEVYHRVKNNLQVVQSLLSLQRQALPDEGIARAAIDDSVLRIRAMALVHEKLYQSDNLAAISLQTYTRDLLKQIADANSAHSRKVRLHAEVPDVETGLDSAIPFGLLLTELVSNSFKHAFKSQAEGEVWVSLVPGESGALLTVADNGAGFEADLPRASRTSMGLKLAGSLARQLGGELSVRQEGGAVFSAVLTRI
jgi:PAS domain S-box-containing protein